MSDGGFSLARLEYLAYSRRYEDAAAEIMKLLADLDVRHGRLSNIGVAASGDPMAEHRDAHFATRIAAAVSSLFSDPKFHLSQLGFQRLIPLQRWLTIIFGASPFANADHIIRLFNEGGYDKQEQIVLQDRDLLKFCLLYSLDSSIPLQPDVLWLKDKRLAAALFAALLSSRIVATDDAHAKKEQLLEWLPPRLKEVALDDFPIGIVHDVWMHCSYAYRPDKHAIKRAINEMVRAKLLAAGFKDLNGEPRPNRAKPVVLCVLEWFDSNHSIYRTHSVSMEALKAKYRLIGVSLRETSDEISRRIFDEVHVLSRKLPILDAVRQIMEIASAQRPDIIYYPSVGMFPDSVFLINLRLAPIQIVALGHPATTHSPFVDYVIVEEDYVGDPNCFSERVVAIPRESIPYRPPANCPHIAADIRSSPDPVRIAVAASLMKINPIFLRALDQIKQQARVAVEFRFFSSSAFGLTKVYLQNVVRAFLHDSAVMHPHLPYGAYLESINRCDMFLNPFPFGNTNGIVDTVRQGLPGVCLTGPEVHTHIDEGLFRRLGLPDWLIAGSVDEYVRAAVRLVDNGPERHDLSLQLLRTDPDSVLFRGNPKLFLEAVSWLHENHARHMASTTRLLRPPRDTSRST